MKIACVLTSDERGGGEYATVDLLAGLQALGHDVLLLTNQIALAEGTPVPTRRVRLGPKLGRSTRWTLALAAPLHLVQLWRAVRRERTVDALLFVYKKEQLLGALLPRSLARTTVWAEWGPLPREFRNGLARALYARAARSVAAIIAISEGTRESLEGAGAALNRVTVLPPAVAIPDPPAPVATLRERYSLPVEGFVAVCIGRLHRDKRTDVVVNALELLPEDVTLVIAGDGEESAALRARASKLGPRVRFMATPRGHVDELLGAADVVIVAPSQSEGALRSVALAQAVGRPVVATSATGVRDLLAPGTGAIADPPNEPAALAACVRAYYDDRDRSAREGELAREYAVRTFDLEAISRRVEAILVRAAGYDEAARGK
jgi:glycosyltransferase involved in cell wall biosynthesis